MHVVQPSAATHERYCNCGSPSVFFLASSISVTRDQDFGAGLQVGRFQQRLLFRRAIGRHHRQRIDQRLVRRLLDAVPVGLQLVGLEEGAQRRQQRLAVDRVLALARDEIVGERRVGDAALAIGRRDRQLLLDAEARDAGELEQIAAVAALGELGDAADAADLVERRLVGRTRYGAGRAGSCRSADGRRAARRRSSRDSAARKC